MREPPDQEAAGGELRPGQGTLQASLKVLRSPPAAGHPGEGSFHHPATVENGERLDSLGFVDDLHHIRHAHHEPFRALRS